MAEDIRFPVDRDTLTAAHALGKHLAGEARRKFGLEGPRPTLLYNPAQRKRLRQAAAALKAACTAEALNDAAVGAQAAIHGLGMRGFRTYEAPRRGIIAATDLTAKLERELREERALEDARVAQGLCGLCERPLAEYPSLEATGDRCCYFCAEEVRCMVGEAKAEFAEEVS